MSRSLTSARLHCGCANPHARHEVNVFMTGGDCRQATGLGRLPRIDHRQSAKGKISNVACGQARAARTRDGSDLCIELAGRMSATSPIGRNRGKLARSGIVERQQAIGKIFIEKTVRGRTQPIPSSPRGQQSEPIQDFRLRHGGNEQAADVVLRDPVLHAFSGTGRINSDSTLVSRTITA
jgi:hypothetical protein